MIIVSNVKLEIGKIIKNYYGIWMPQQKQYYKDPFVVIKEVSYEDYINQCKEYEEILHELFIYHKLTDDKYYLISVD